MRVGHGLIIGSVALAWPGVASEPIDNAPPTPEQREPTRAPEEPQPDWRKMGIDKGTVVQVEEPAAQGGPAPPPPPLGPRYRTEFVLVEDSCIGVSNDKRTLYDHRPFSKGSGFYLPLPHFSSIFKDPVVLQSVSSTAMRYVGPVNLDVPMMLSGVATGKFLGWWEVGRFQFEKFNVTFELTGSCRIKGFFKGERTG